MPSNLYFLLDKIQQYNKSGYNTVHDCMEKKNKTIPTISKLSMIPSKCHRVQNKFKILKILMSLNYD